MTFYRRNLPHWQPEGKAIFLTWRLFGSLPITRRMPVPLSTSPERVHQAPDWGRKFRMIDAELDRGAYGPIWLRRREIASYVEEAIIHGTKSGCFQLHAYVVMPNHVHLLIEPRVALRRITAGIKNSSARHANILLRRAGKHFWQDESFDHWVRNEASFQRIRSYIERNPVMARLVKQPEDWPWSSASNEKAAKGSR